MHIGKKAHFEQDETYTDMNEQLRTFTKRDYTKKISVAASTKGSVEDYESSIWACVDELIQENPPSLAIDSEVVDAGEWDRDCLYTMFIDPNKVYIGSRLSNLKSLLIASILDRIGHTDAFDWSQRVDAFRDAYKRDGEVL